ncbi:MAG TPA: L-serine ammonia-lyase, partial [Legionellales bacterium]|nr:L-serine ammonia-lyase [Legionellales bacterium]
MPISFFDLFSIGIGPSSSHTVGPMIAAHQFVTHLKLDNIQRIQVKLYGSLALTGKGHATDLAILNGLSGYLPDTVVPEEMKPLAQKIEQKQKIHINQQKWLPFDIKNDLLFLQKEVLPKHSNGMSFHAFNALGEEVFSEIIYSIGGGFIVAD